MPSKTKIAVEITGKLLVPVDLSILETLRTEMMGEALHDQIVEEALRVGVSSCLAGYNEVTMKRELMPLPAPGTNNSKKSQQQQNNESSKNSKKASSKTSKLSTAQLLEAEAEKMNPNKKNSDDDDDDEFPATKQLRKQQEQQKSETQEKDYNASRFDGQRFIATVNFGGLQMSIERLLNAFDSMATKVDETINGPLSELENMKSTLPPAAVEALEKLKDSLSQAIASPEIPTEVPVSRYSSGNDDNDDNQIAKSKSRKQKIRVSGTVVSVEEEEDNDNDDDNDDDDSVGKSDDGPTVERKSLLAGSDDSDDDDDDDSKEGGWRRKNPAEMGYQPLGDDE